MDTASPSGLILISDSQVIQKIGLCISFYDLLESSDGLIGHGTGLVNVNGKSPCYSASVATFTDFAPVKFRMIVFRPFKGEIMLGKISSGTENGIKSTFHMLLLWHHKLTMRQLVWNSSMTS